MKKNVVTVSTKGQIALPAEVREELSIGKGTKMVLVAEKGMIVMKPLRRLSEFEGILSEVKKPAREIVKELREEWEVKLV